MIDVYLVPGAYRATTSAHELYDGLSSTTLTLTGTLPSVAFKCLVRLYASGSHTDCAGTVTIGTETLTFTVAAKKITTTLLTALPTITTSNLDCCIEITCLDTQGAIITAETLTAIDTRIEPVTQRIQLSSGEWSNQIGVQIFSDTELNVGDVVRKGTHNYKISFVDEDTGLGGEVLFYTYLAD